MNVEEAKVNERCRSSATMSMMGDDDGMMTMTSHAEETDDDGKD